MPRDITVKFADGTSTVYRNAPDDVTPEQVQSRAEQESGQAVASMDGGKRGALESAGRYAAFTGSNLVKGALGLPAMMADAAEKPSNFLATPAGLVIATGKALKQRIMPEQAGSMELAPKLDALGPKPENTAEQYAAAGLQGVGGAMTSGGALAAPAKSAIIGGAAGLSGEAGAQAAGKGTAMEPVARLVASLLGGGVAGAGMHLATRNRPQSADLAKEAVEGITPAHFKAAQELQAASAKQGVDMTLDQALTAVGVPASNLSTIKNALAKSKSGNEVQSTLNRQSGQLEMLADTTVAKVPGPNSWERGDAANAVQETATTVLNNAKKARTEAVRADYAKAGDLPPEARARLLQIVDEVANRPGATDALKATAAELKTKLSGKSEALKAVEAARAAVAEAAPGGGKAQATAALQKALASAEADVGKPLKALDVDVAISDAMGAYKGTPTYLANPQATGQVKGLGARLNEEFQKLSPEVAAAEAKYKAISEATVNPLKKSAIGRLAGTRGALPDREANAAALEGIFNRGSDAQVSRNEITELASKLSTVDKDAFPAAFKTYLRGKLDAAIESSPGKVVPDATNSGNTAGRIYESLFKTRAQLNGVGSATEAVARGYGLDPKAARAGLENLAQITNALRNRPGVVGGLNEQDIKTMSGGSVTANAVRLYGFLPLERVARNMEQRDLDKTFREFDRILTTPEGAALLQKLAKVPVMSSKAITLLSTFGGTVGSAEAKPSDESKSPRIPNP